MHKKYNTGSLYNIIILELDNITKIIYSHVGNYNEFWP